MKRIFIIAVALGLCSGAWAQSTARIKAAVSRGGDSPVVAGSMQRLWPEGAKAVAAVSVPEGAAPVDYLLVDVEKLASYDMQLSRISRHTIMYDGSTVYIPQMLMRSVLGDVYLEGRFNATQDSILIDTGQTVATIDDGGQTVELRFGLLDAASAMPVDAPLKLAVGSGDDQGFIYAGEDDIVGLLRYVGGRYDGYYSYGLGMTYVDASMVEHYADYRVSCTTEAFDGTVTEDVTGDVEVGILDDGEDAMMLARGILPDYPDGYVLGEGGDYGYSFIGSAMLVGDDAIFCPAEEKSGVFTSEATFVPQADGSFSLADGTMLADIYINNGYFYYRHLYRDVTLTPAFTGIHSPEAVSTVTSVAQDAADGPLYDLSGRRVGKGFKGIVITNDGRKIMK